MDKADIQAGGEESWIKEVPIKLDKKWKGSQKPELKV